MPESARSTVNRLGLACRLVFGLGAGLTVAGGSSLAAPPDTTQGIYTCVDAQGRRLTSDRPIPDCNAREQRVLNKDGSLRAVKPPPLTADERAEKEAAERQAAVQKAAQADAVRRDRNLLARFGNEADHRKARESALDTVRAAIKTTEVRQAELTAERQPLELEAEFYKGRTLPLRLKQQIDANDAAVDAQKSLAQNQTQELARINRLYDAELERLRRLWAGAQPGTIGPATASTALKPAAASAPR
ncbi:DUF4124 domain-containing protein [Ideonella sp. A 288]|uniref:DUF4124 domain-containing protein n=1 Tax=Ideonella sp. A 288 TaxID=1962181 RepID=UPI00118573EE|nr:DUF4124 domain-containing protein [Ideonella sp. A 288]